MSQQATRVRKSKGSETATTNVAVKAPKSNDAKTDHNKPEKQPTAEQIRIAQIIDTKSEDPNIKDKLKQVMDATQRSADEAYTALHDSDNDPNRAVNLLLEGGIKSEWSTSSKKKKYRIPNDKGKESGPNASDSNAVTSVENEDCWDAPPQPQRSTNKQESRGGGSRNRVYHKVGRGKAGVINNNSNSNNNNNGEEKSKRNSKQMNGPGRGFRGGRQSARGISRGRQGFRRTMETWGESNENTNHQLDHMSLSLNQDDWDNEEYTGSLANSQVFTPSAPPESNSLQALEPLPIIKDDGSKDNLQGMGPLGVENNSDLPSQILSALVMPQTRVMPNPPVNNSRTNDSLSHEVNPSALGMPKSDFMYMGRGSRLTLMNYSTSVDDRLSRVNSTSVASSKPKPRIPPPSKIPSSAVEMPPEIDNTMGLLDVQFGALEFGETPSETVALTPNSSNPSSPSPASESLAAPAVPASESILTNDTRSFSPSPGTGANNSLTSQLADVSSSKMPESTDSSLYHYPYQSSLDAKPSQAAQSIYNSTYSAGQILTSNNTIYSTSSSTQSTYASSSAGSYGNTSYPTYQYPNYPNSQPSALQNNSSNSYQSVGVGSGQPYGGSNSQSVYGNSVLSSSSYSPYQSYNNSSQHNHKSLSSTTNSKEFDSSQSAVNLSSITHSSSAITGAPTLLSSTQTTPTSKPSSSSSMSKGAVVSNMPPGVAAPLVGTQYIVNQGGMPYFQQPPVYYESLEIVPPQRLPTIAAAGYYEMGYQPTTTREGVQYNMSDVRFARADNTSPVQVSSINQQSATQGHQQPLMNPATALPPPYAYFYSGSMIPSNFPTFSTPLYPVAATGSTSGHASTNSGVYGKGPANYAGNYGGIYESSQQSVGDYKASSSSQGSKVQPTQSANPATSADVSILYSSKSALSKSFDKTAFHCPTPPPFNLGSQNSGLGPTGGYPQHHLFIPTMNPHHSTTLMHQPIHQDGSNSVSGRSQVGNQQNKVVAKSNYSPSTYWSQN